mmetsp:Transcript_29840/g.88356  ORF Transcript_29840/g.88356 Transcript_29840/m.88356 type:complete len:352 (-) Transcript_29840:2791-3846(-)
MAHGGVAVRRDVVMPRLQRGVLCGCGHLCVGHGPVQALLSLRELVLEPPHCVLRFALQPLHILLLEGDAGSRLGQLFSQSCFGGLQVCDVLRLPVKGLLCVRQLGLQPQLLSGHLVYLVAQQAELRFAVQQLALHVALCGCDHVGGNLLLRQQLLQRPRTPVGLLNALAHLGAERRVARAGAPLHLPQAAAGEVLFVVAQLGLQLAHVLIHFIELRFNLSAHPAGVGGLCLTCLHPPAELRLAGVGVEDGSCFFVRIPGLLELGVLFVDHHLQLQRPSTQPVPLPVLHHNVLASRSAVVQRRGHLARGTAQTERRRDMCRVLRDGIQQVLRQLGRRRRPYEAVIAIVLQFF